MKDEKQQARNAEIEQIFHDYLLDGESTMTQATVELKMCSSVLNAAAKRLEDRGEIERRLVTSHYKKTEWRWSVRRTQRKAA